MFLLLRETPAGAQRASSAEGGTTRPLLPSVGPNPAALDSPDGEVLGIMTLRAAGSPEFVPPAEGDEGRLLAAWRLSSPLDEGLRKGPVLLKGERASLSACWGRRGWGATTGGRLGSLPGPVKAGGSRGTMFHPLPTYIVQNIAHYAQNSQIFKIDLVVHSNVINDSTTASHQRSSVRTMTVRRLHCSHCRCHELTVREQYPMPHTL